MARVLIDDEETELRDEVFLAVQRMSLNSRGCKVVAFWAEKLVQHVANDSWQAAFDFGDVRRANKREVEEAVFPEEKPMWQVLEGESDRLIRSAFIGPKVVARCCLVRIKDEGCILAVLRCQVLMQERAKRLFLAAA